MKPRFLKIKDKKIISKDKFCPTHCIHHKLPFTKQITNEPCHIHNKKWRIMHHKIFCKLLNCQHYKFMIKKSKELK